MSDVCRLHISRRVEEAIRRHIAPRCAPPRLGAAIEDAMFPGGARVRPNFLLAVSLACGDDRPAVSNAAAVAIECLHCASLVHDDLPCFDDAAQRRGKPAVHVTHGEALAVLAGDALIVMAFQILSDVAESAGERLPGLLAILAECAGTPAGLVGGQAMESERQQDLDRYHAAKTGALFEAAAAAGAVSAGHDAAVWRRIGHSLGAAYQIADDLHDALGLGGEGKPTGQDALHERPTAVSRHGIDGAVAALRDHLDAAADNVPEGPANHALVMLIREQTGRFLPASLSSRLTA